MLLRCLGNRANASFGGESRCWATVGKVRVWLNLGVI
jgi:hypothetical protein